MSGNLLGMVAIASPFIGRKPAFGSAYAVTKDKMALADPAGRRLGVDEAAMSATFVITEEIADRVGDVVSVEGMSLENFRRNPIAFYNHQAAPSFALPIGKWEDPNGNLTIIKEVRRAIGTLFFSQKNREAYQIFQLVVEAILRACSLGFNPTSEPVKRGYNEPNPHSIERGFYFPAIDVLEVSVVGTPCVPTATLVRAHLSAGKIAGEPISDMLRKSLEPLAEPAPVWSPGGFAPTAAGASQSTPETENTPPGGDTPMSKKWRKTAPATKARDAAGHEHGNDGRFTSGGGGGSSGGGAKPPAREKPKPADKPRVSVREAQDAAMQLGPKRTEEIVGPGGLSGASPAALRKLVEEARKHGGDDGGGGGDGGGGSDGDPVSVRAAQDAAMKLGDERTEEIVGPGGLSGASASALRRLIDEANKHGKSTPSEHEQRGDLMSKKWKKTAPRRKDGMSETSGTAGGYGATMPKPQPEGERIKSDIRDVMEKHKGGDPDYHHAYYKAETGEVHHTVGDAAEEGHAERVKADLEAIDGVNAVHQGDEHGPAEGEGYEKVYPPVAEESQEKAARLARQKTMRLVRRKAQTAYHIGRGKSLMQLRHLLDPKKKDALEACVHRKIPRIADDHPEMDEDQRIAVAYSMCGESKGMLDEDDYEHKDDMDGDADDVNPMGPGDAEDPTGEKRPPSLEVAQMIIENLESELPGMEPEDREFVQSLIDQTREWGKSKHPGEDFGGGQEEAGLGEEAAQEAEDEEETEELLSGYKARQAARKKALQAARKKSLEDLANGDHHKMLRKSADLHHQIGDMEDGAPINKRLKAMCKEMGRGMDGLHAIVTHNMPPEEVKEVESQEGEKPGEMALEPTPAGESHEDMEMKSAGVDWSAVMRRLDGVAEQAKTNQDAFYSVTGKR